MAIELQFRLAALDSRVYGDGSSVQDLSGLVVFQDWQLTQGQRIRGYQEPCFAAQETRVHRFHEVLNDYLAGYPPGRD